MSWVSKAVLLAGGMTGCGASAVQCVCNWFCVEEPAHVTHAAPDPHSSPPAAVGANGAGKSNFFHGNLQEKGFLGFEAGSCMSHVGSADCCGDQLP